ncbi:hypothetical protein [Streptomyces sp. NPDC057580]|uniref:hypothetical protein n=1 Tax=Streptomyces sp. NPDC057580 TaxID=3346173 RepID=UPI0036C43CB8
MPLLFIEVDNCHETAEEIADKLEKYARFFRRKVKDTDSKERPMWRTRWTVPEGRPSDVPHPAVLLVFNRIGDRNPDRTIPRLIELTRNLWEGERFEDHHLYDGKIPIVATRLRNLREHGPAGPVFLRFGRDRMQSLREVIGNPRREAADARKRAEYEAREREYKEQLLRVAEEHRAEREARRPVCADCGLCCRPAECSGRSGDAPRPRVRRDRRLLRGGADQGRACPGEDLVAVLDYAEIVHLLAGLRLKAQGLFATGVGRVAEGAGRVPRRGPGGSGRGEPEDVVTCRS